MVAFLSSAKKSKVAPSRHWSTIQGLLAHSRQLHQVLKAVEIQESREQCRRLLSAIDFEEPIASMPRRESIEPKSKPIVFRKTKREIQRERELAQQQKQLAVPSKKSIEGQRFIQESHAIKHKINNVRTALIVSCKRLPTMAATTPHSHQRRMARQSSYLQRSANGLSRRCPPRRRLLF